MKRKIENRELKKFKYLNGMACSKIRYFVIIFAYIYELERNTIDNYTN